MGAPAIVQGDKVTGVCMDHLMPSGSGTQPAGPQQFSASINAGVVPSVLIYGKPAAVENASGTNRSQHAGLVDAPFASPTSQIGTIMTGSTTVFIDGQPAATATSQATCCRPTTPGKVGPGVPTVLIG